MRDQTGSEQLLPFNEWSFGQRRESDPLLPWSWGRGGGLWGIQQTHELPRAFSVEWGQRYCGTDGLLGAIAWKIIKMFCRHLVNMKCYTNGNNNVRFYLTSSLRTQNGAGRLLMKSTERPKLGTAGNCTAWTSKHSWDR